MTGRDLIIYILQNNLEDKPIFKDGKLLGFMTVSEAALNFNVGTSTIMAWIQLGVLKSIKIEDKYYIPAKAAVNNEYLSKTNSTLRTEKG